MSEPAGPEIKPIPEKNPTRRWVIIASVAAAVLLIAGAATWALWPESEEDKRDRVIDEISKKPPVVLPTPDVSSTPTSTDATPSPGATSSPGGGSGGGTSANTLAPYVAYRRGGKLWVVREDGRQPREVANSAEGPYALSPNGSTLAWVETKDAALYVLPLAGGAAVKVGPAQPVMPAWTPDSSAVVYVAGTASAGEVWQASAAGAGAKKLADGDRAATGAGGVVAAIAVEKTPRVTVIRSGSAKSFDGPAGARDVAVGTDVLYFVAEGANGGCEIWTTSFSGAGARKVASSTGDDKPADCGSLMLSPDGSRLVYAEVGDDGYSRMFAIATSGGTPTLLSPRRDGYPLRWTSDGGSVLFIEGNRLQGEVTGLLRVRSDGAGRILVARDATN